MSDELPPLSSSLFDAITAFWSAAYSDGHIGYPHDARAKERERRAWDRLTEEIRAYARAALAAQAAQPDMAEPSGGREAGPEEDRIEAAYWLFDARHKGYGQWSAAPMSERYAFKAEMRNALAAEKVRAQMRLVANGWRRPEVLAQPPAQPALCRTDGRCQYAIDHGAEGMGHCPDGKCCMPSQPVAEPVATLHDDGCFTWKREEFRRQYDRQRAGWRMDVYATPQPQGEDAPTLTDEQIASVCLSYRHDFGLLANHQKMALMAEAREWLRAIDKERAATKGER